MLNNLCILSIFDNINFTVRNFQPNALLGYHYFIPAVRDRSDQMRGRSPLKIGGDRCAPSRWYFQRKKWERKLHRYLSFKRILSPRGISNSIDVCAKASSRAEWMIFQSAPG